MLRMISRKSFFFRALLLIFFIFLAFETGFFCFAETVFLKNGTKIEGMIQELTGEDLTIDVAGVPLRYDLADIKRVDVLDSYKGWTREDVTDFLEGINLMIADDLRDEAEKQDEIMQLRLEDKPSYGYLVSEEARDLVARHRREIDMLQAPPLCVYLKKLYIRWMLLRESKHNALYRANWQEAERLEEQIDDYVDKIHTELNRIRWLLRDEKAYGDREYVFRLLSEQVEMPLLKENKKVRPGGKSEEEKR